ncbi:hypothetical protein FRC12_019363, partial [Ceratobasidium sp. 428]
CFGRFLQNASYRATSPPVGSSRRALHVRSTALDWTRNLPPSVLGSSDPGSVGVGREEFGSGTRFAAEGPGDGETDVRRSLPSLGVGVAPFNPFAP